MTDSHIHLHEAPLFNQLAELLVQAEQRGITKFVSASINLASWQANKEIKKKYPHVLIGFGIHPWHSALYTPDFLTTELSQDILTHAVAISEIGLDTECDVPMMQQETLLRAQLAFAEQHQLPIVLHWRASWEKLFSLLTEFKVHGVVHNFTGSNQTALRLRALNFFPSFSGFITRPGVKRANNALKSLSPADILLETDAPDLTPAGCSYPNIPTNISHTAQWVAQQMGISTEQLWNQVDKNFELVFKEKK